MPRWTLWTSFQQNNALCPDLFVYSDLSLSASNPTSLFEAETKTPLIWEGHLNSKYFLTLTEGFPVTC